MNKTKKVMTKKKVFTLNINYNFKFGIKPAQLVCYWYPKKFVLPINFLSLLKNSDLAQIFETWRAIARRPSARIANPIFNNSSY